MNEDYNFLINKRETYLNFGSFGSCPKEIFNYYQKLQLELEQQPVEFIVDKANQLFQEARESLSEYLNCSSDDLVLMTNPSYAINTVAKSIVLKPGDEVLTSNMEYGALIETWKRICSKSTAKFVEAPISFPILNKKAFLEEFWKGYTSNTKAIFLSHITSSTALILPIEDICKEAKRRGLITIIDGAHAPGQLSLNLKELDVDIYVGACHKWMMCPKGVSFLYASKKAQDWLEPLVISWGTLDSHKKNVKFVDDHQTNGTRDLSALLTVTRAIEFMKTNNWNKVSSKCKQLTLSYASEVQKEFGFTSLSPITSEWIGQMYSIPVVLSCDIDLRALIKKNYQIEIPMTFLGDNKFVRFSIQAFNDNRDLDNLRQTLIDLKEKKMLSFN